MIAKITKAYTRHYTDNGQTKSYVEWIDDKGAAGRTEGAYPLGVHMTTLFNRAHREGVQITRERW